MIPTMQEIAAEFVGKIVFSTLEWYWQVQLDEVHYFHTFSIPFCRYYRMPFGIKSAKSKRRFQGFLVYTL